MNTRIEKDALGEKEIPGEKYWGIHTARAIENFPISGQTTSFDLIQAFAMVKKAACLSNYEIEAIDEDKSNAIIKACDEIIEGNFEDQFPLDSLQGGAGTSTNMNMNEVIANRALEILGEEKGEYTIVNPIEDVNLHQSTNDTYPTALKIAVIFKLRELSELLADLQNIFQEKEKEFSSIATIGRTEYQNAVPITLGAEFGSFSEAFARDRWRTFKCEERIRMVNIGGTAVGTGLTAPQTYIFKVIEKLRSITGLGLSRSENCIDGTANNDCFVEISATMKSTAVNLIKICKALRLLHFTGEINLPAVQAGSSIMPGKVNPVIIESIIQAAMKIKTNDILIADAASDGTLQINEYMPLIANSILESLSFLKQTTIMLTKHCSQITANKDTCAQLFDHDPTIITAFLPYIGYDKCGELVQEFKESEFKSVREFLNSILGKEDVDEVLAPDNLVSLGY